MTDLTRRGFLGGLIAAPAVIRTAGLLMPVKAFAEDRFLLFGRPIGEVYLEVVDMTLRPPVVYDEVTGNIWPLALSADGVSRYRVPAPRSSRFIRPVAEFPDSPTAYLDD